MMQRRSFLAGILAAGMAPAVARSGILMPIKKIWTPPPLSIASTSVVTCDILAIAGSTYGTLMLQAVRCGVIEPGVPLQRYLEGPDPMLRLEPLSPGAVAVPWEQITFAMPIKENRP